MILRESRPARLAHEFVNYLLRPEVSSAIAVACGTATANAAAMRLLPEAMGHNTTLYPGPEILSRGQWFETLTPATQRLRDRLWDRDQIGIESGAGFSLRGASAPQEAR